MELMGMELAVLPRMYGCDCCSTWLQEGELAVILCYQNTKGSLFFEWECLDCQGVGGICTHTENS